MNKRGISEVVSYVLLIVIAIGIAGTVYTYLKIYVPKEKPECKEGIDLIINRANCVNNNAQNILTLTLENKGLFKVDKAFVRIGESSDSFKVNIPTEDPINLLARDGSIGLDPGELSDLPDLNLPNNAAGNYVLEVQPAFFIKDRRKDSLALCPPITEIIACN